MSKPAEKSYRVKLWEVDGERRWWTIQFKPLKRGDGRTQYGRCSLDKRIITINSRLRNPDKIRFTLLHEVSHVATGEIASERLIQYVEENFQDAVKHL